MGAESFPGLASIFCADLVSALCLFLSLAGTQEIRQNAGTCNEQGASGSVRSAPFRRLVHLPSAPPEPSGLLPRSGAAPARRRLPGPPDAKEELFPLRAKKRSRRRSR